MVSAQISGILKLYRVDTNNNQHFITGGNIAALGPSGSSEGVIASTPEKWLYVNPIVSDDKRLRTNEKLLATFTPAAAATIGTATKSKAVIPIVYQDGSSDVINDFASSVDWDVKILATKAVIAGDETPIAIKTIRQPFAIGGGKIFTSIENNS